MNEELLRALGINVEQAKEQALNRGILGGILNLAAMSGPQARPVGTAQGLAQAVMGGVGEYESSFDRTLKNALTNLQVRQSIAQANQPKYMTIKTGENMETLLAIPPGGGTPTPVSLPGVLSGTPIKFDAETQGFSTLVFGKPFNQLDANQQRAVIEFSLAPDDTKMAELRAKAQEVGINTPGGAQPALPKSRRDILTDLLQNRPAVTPAAPSAPAAPPAAAPVAAPVVSPVSRTTPVEPVTSAMIKTSGSVQLPVGMADKPLGKDEAPIINSKGISPKQKSELELARPQTFSAIENSLNTTRQARNTIREILNDSNFNMAFGFGGETVSKVYTPAADVRAKLDQLRNQLFVEGITALRDASKTGAGVGNVTETEGKRFENLRGSLVQFQSADQARQELQRIEKELEASEGRIKNAYSRVYGNTEFSVSPLFVAPQKGNLRGILGLPLPRR